MIMRCLTSAHGHQFAAAGHQRGTSLEHKRWNAARETNSIEGHIPFGYISHTLIRPGAAHVGQELLVRHRLGT